MCPVTPPLTGSQVKGMIDGGLRLEDGRAAPPASEGGSPRFSTIRSFQFHSNECVLIINANGITQL